MRLTALATSSSQRESTCSPRFLSDNQSHFAITNMTNTTNDTSTDDWVDERMMRLRIWPEDPYVISGQTLKKLCREGRFPHLKLGGQYFFKVAEVRKFLLDKRVTLVAAISAQKWHQERISKIKARGRGRSRV
jgi:hypothetical protein